MKIDCLDFPDEQTINLFQEGADIQTYLDLDEPEIPTGMTLRVIQFVTVKKDDIVFDHPFFLPMNVDSNAHWSEEPILC